MIAGYVFLCSDMTEGECLERMLFGGREKYASRVRGLKRGDTLYLYNYESKKLHGIFEAVTELQRDIVPTAWNGGYPMQVRVRRTLDPKPLSRDDIRDLFKFDRNGRPSTRLEEEVIDTLKRRFESKKRTPYYDDSVPYTARDGHKVRSKAEETIDNWLYKHGIVHGYGTEIPEAKRCDFEIPTPTGPVYIEYWGSLDEEYIKNRKQKEAIYKKYQMPLISIEPGNLKDLEEILGKFV